MAQNSSNLPQAFPASQFTSFSGVSSMSTSGDTQKHKVSVVIEPPTAASPQIAVALNEPEDYAASVPVSKPSSAPVANVVDIPSNNVLQPPTVWGPAGCSQNPTPLPVLINFEFQSSEETGSNMTEQEEPAQETPKLETVIEEAPKSSEPAIETASESTTPEPSNTIPIGTSLGYSTSVRGEDERTASISPPQASYAWSPPTDMLSYSRTSPTHQSNRDASIGAYAGPVSAASSNVPDYFTTSAAIAYAGAQ